MSHWGAETKITRCLPSPAICEVVTELVRKTCEWQTEGVWTSDPVSITGTEKNSNANWPWSHAKQWRVTLFGFPLKGNLVFLRISLRNPLFTDGNHGAVKTELYNSAAWFQLKHWISKAITPILMCLFKKKFFYVYPVYFDGKFVGGALVNWYGKPAPVVDQCFESQKHWLFAFFSSEQEPNFFPKKTIPDCIWRLRLSGTLQLHSGCAFFKPWLHS